MMNDDVMRFKDLPLGTKFRWPYLGASTKDGYDGRISIRLSIASARPAKARAAWMYVDDGVTVYVASDVDMERLVKVVMKKPKSTTTTKWPKQRPLKDADIWKGILANDARVLKKKGLVADDPVLTPKCSACNGTGQVYMDRDLHRSAGYIPCPRCHQK